MRTMSKGAGAQNAAHAYDRYIPKARKKNTLTRTEARTDCGVTEFLGVLGLLAD
jgi:hypothetical protein